MHKSFKMKYGHHSAQIICIPLTTLLVVIFTLIKGKVNVKIYGMCFFFSGASTVYKTYAVTVTILHTETFVTVDFGPLLYFKTDY